MTVPTTCRRSAAIPKAMVLIDGVPVTKALRTLIDVASSEEIPLADSELAFAEAVKSGSITRADISSAKLDPTRRDILRALQGQAGKR